MGTFNQFWMIYVSGGNIPTVEHGNYENAKKEAERLALLPSNQGKRVFVLSATDCCVYNTVQWLEPEVEVQF